MERLNDSIRTYVWAILGAQAQTRSNILKTGTGYDAQQISKTRLPRPLTSLVASLGIRKHCNMHPHPWTSCSGLGCICRRATGTPSGQYPGYNNEIQIAGSDAAIGHNPGINKAEPIASKGDKAFQGKVASPAGTRGHKGSQPSQNKTRVSAADSDGTSAENRQSATAHEEEKTALVAIGVAGGLAAFWLSSR